MVGVEVDGHDPLGLVDQVVEDIAAAAGDREDARFGAHLQSLRVDPRVFPDLVVNKALEPEREHPLQHAPLAGEFVVVDGLAKAVSRGVPGGGGVHGGNVLQELSGL